MFNLKKKGAISEMMVIILLIVVLAAVIILWLSWSGSGRKLLGGLADMFPGDVLP